MPPFFGERERLKERIVYVFETFLFFASALLGGIDLRFSRSSSSSGLRQQHLILSFLEKEGEKEGEREGEGERERTDTLYIPTLSFMALRLFCLLFF